MRKVKIVGTQVIDEKDIRIRCKNNPSWTCKTNCAAYFESRNVKTEVRYAHCNDLPLDIDILYNQAIGELVEGE